MGLVLKGLMRRERLENMVINLISFSFSSLLVLAGNYSDSMSLDSVGRPQLNRCHSVPVQRQITASLCNSYQPSEMIATPSSISSMLRGEGEHSISKSYPPTPVCTSNSFQFPSSPSANAVKLASATIAEEDGTSPTFIEGGHDVMVSGLQSNKDWSTNEMDINVNGDNNMAGHSPFNYDLRRTVDENNSSSTPLGVDLETTLEDLRDCDNDFSKFTLDFELGTEETSNTVADM